MLLRHRIGTLRVSMVERFLGESVLVDGQPEPEQRVFCHVQNRGVEYHTYVLMLLPSDGQGACKVRGGRVAAGRTPTSPPRVLVMKSRPGVTLYPNLPYPSQQLLQHLSVLCMRRCARWATATSTSCTSRRGRPAAWCSSRGCPTSASRATGRSRRCARCVLPRHPLPPTWVGSWHQVVARASVLLCTSCKLSQAKRVLWQVLNGVWHCRPGRAPAAVPAVQQNVALHRQTCVALCSKHALACAVQERARFVAEALQKRVCRAAETVPVVHRDISLHYFLAYMQQT